MATISSIDASFESSSSSGVYFCSTCDKPFTNESSYLRHVRYCGSRTRSRLRSCRACNAAKTKCSFGKPCLRCEKKSIQCLYEETAVVSKRTLPRSSATAVYSSMPSSSLTIGSSYSDDGMLSNGEVILVDHTAAHGTQFQDISTYRFPSIAQSSQKPSFNEPLDLDELLAFDNYTSGQLQITSYNKQPQPGHWCDWAKQGVSLSVMTENHLIKPNSNLQANLLIERPHAQQNAELIIQSLRSFPMMMLRKETFPWFIHPHSHLLSKPAKTTLPEALSSCMSIAQLFACRSSETKGFLQRTIRAEYRRFIGEMYQMSKFELLASLQACMVYLIMWMVDYSPEDEGNGLEIVLTISDLYMLFKKVSGGGQVCPNELTNPSANWEDWIYNESQRRLTHLWLLFGCVVCIKTGQTCDTSGTYRHLPLPCPKTLWEASTQFTWESEFQASRISQMNGFVSLGDLIDAQQSVYTPLNAQKLDCWNAGVDNLGLLLNLVGTMI